MPNPSDFFGSFNSPVAAAKLWLVWIGMAIFVGAIFSLLRDWSANHRVGLITYGLFVVLVLLLVFIFMPQPGRA